MMDHGASLLPSQGNVRNEIQCPALPALDHDDPYGGLTSPTSARVDSARLADPALQCLQMAQGL